MGNPKVFIPTKKDKQFFVLLVFKFGFLPLFFI